jgi:hypothetical protein
MTLPACRVPRVSASWDQGDNPQGWAWREGVALAPFLLADGSAPATQQTRVRLCWNERALYARFDCDDRDIWGEHTRRDAPLYDEEAVELFLSPGSDTPTRYYEFEVSPNGVLLDALIDNPTARRIDLRANLDWDCTGLRWWAWRDDTAQCWGAVLAVPWAALLPNGGAPTAWRANCYRIERPRDGAVEFSCWSPTLTRPADFHKPARFGCLHLV